MKKYTSPSIKIGLFVDAGNDIITTSEEMNIVEPTPRINQTATLTDETGTIVY